jgi:1-acyl-sn-glycerol-3-phosphate acyltransferase
MEQVLSRIDTVRNACVRSWFVCAQHCTIPANICVTILLRLKITRPHNFRIPQGTLIIANHQSRIDPFLISYHIGMHNLRHTLPIRYPVTPSYIRRPILGLIIRMLGGYDIGNSTIERLQRLIFTRDLLRKKYTIVLFPEGKIVRERNNIAAFQRGASMLFALQCPVVFVRLTGLNQHHRFYFWEGNKAHLTYSKVYEATLSAEEKILAMEQFFTSSDTPNLVQDTVQGAS